MFLWRNKKIINTFWLKKLYMREFCLFTEVTLGGANVRKAVADTISSLLSKSPFHSLHLL